MDDLDLLAQTFNVIEESYNTEPVISEVTPTPGFFRRKSSRPPKGSVPLFDLDEVPVRGEYDH